MVSWTGLSKLFGIIRALDARSAMEAAQMEYSCALLAQMENILYSELIIGWFLYESISVSEYGERRETAT